MKISELTPDARVWVYQSNRDLKDNEMVEIGELCEAFLAGWSAHGSDLRAGYDIRYKRFLILAVDESHAASSGCAIDSSIHFVKDLERRFGIDFFDRLTVVYRDKQGLESLPLTQFESKLSAGEVDKNTIVFNNLVNTVADLENKWEVPVEASWHGQVMHV